MSRKGKNTDPIIMKERKRIKLFGLPLSFTTYTLTERKLLVNKGFFNTEEDEILLYRIVDMTVKSTFAQKVLGFGIGNLNIISSDKTSPNLVMNNIKNYKEFRKLLSMQVEKERRRVKFRAGELLDRDVHSAESDDYDQDEFDSSDMSTF